MDQFPYAPPSLRDRMEGPGAPAATRPVDWWGWQSRIRDASVPARTPSRARWRPRFVARAGLGVLVGSALVFATFGGVVFGGRPSEAVHASRAAPLPFLSGTAPEYLALGDV